MCPASWRRRGADLKGFRRSRPDQVRGVALRSDPGVITIQTLNREISDARIMPENKNAIFVVGSLNYPSSGIPIV
jgi:hypothetical protein